MITFRALVLIPDSMPDKYGDSFDPAGVELPDHTVMVTNSFRNELDSVLGNAVLSKGEDGRVYADIAFREDINPHYLGSLTPAVGGQIIERQDIEPALGTRIITRCRINQIALGGPNCDHRIHCLINQGFKP